MTSTTEFDLQSVHKHLSAYCFNAAWDLIEKPNRSPQEDEEMINLSHTSLWHWTQREDYDAEKASTAYWQLARIYTLLEQTENARRYAHLCLQVSQEQGVSPFYLGYAYEALARVESVAGNKQNVDAYLQKATDIAKKIVDDQAKIYLLDDLKTIK